MSKLFVIISLMFSFSIKAQQQDFRWVKQIGDNDNQTGLSINLDSAGNIYTVGLFKGTPDFDPGAGTSTITAIGEDMYVTKLDSNGNFIWVKSFGDLFYGRPISVVDKTGNIYITSTFRDTVDFDPGAGTYTLAASYLNVKSFVLKLDYNGNFSWVKEFTSDPFDIAIDKNGYVYSTGSFTGIADFDPSIAAYNLTTTPNTFPDIFILKLDNSGNFIWAKAAGGTDTDQGRSVTVDLNDNVLVTGSFISIGDFDPGPTTYTLSGGLFVLKLDVNGDFIWAKAMNAGGRVIETDLVGNVYVGGNYSGSVDFDPGAGIFSMTAAGTTDLFIEKLDGSGNFIWGKSIGGSSSATIIRGMALDKFGNIYSVGDFSQLSDFDPGPGTYNLIPPDIYNMFVSKLDFNGNFVWAKRTGQYSKEIGYSIALDTIGNVFTTGEFTGTCDFDPSPANYNLYTNSGQNDAFIHKMGPCFTPVAPANITPSVNINFCPNSSTILSASSTGTVTWHSTATNTVVLGTGYNYTTPILSAGSYTYYAQAKTCTISTTRTPIIIYANSAFTPTVLAVGPNTVCLGSSSTFTLSGCISYTSPSTSTSTITSNYLTVLPTFFSNYSITGINNLGCNSAPITVTVTVDNTCADVWPGDANSDGVANNIDVLELGLHYAQTGFPRTITSNTWQSYNSNNWTGYVSTGKNLNHSDCNGDGIINDGDTLAIYNNYGLSHAFKTAQTTTVNSQLNIVPDQASVTKGTWGTASIYLGDASNQIYNINGVAFTVDFDNSLIEANNIYIEYQNSFIDVGQNLDFKKLDINNGKLYTATTHTINSNVFGFGKIATLHYQIKSSLTTDDTLTINITNASSSMAFSNGYILPLTSGTGTLLAMGSSVGLQELNGNIISMSPNPTNGSIAIKSKTELQKIEVISITGKVLLSETPSNLTHILHLENLSNGIYFVNVYKNDRIVNREKIVLSK